MHVCVETEKECYINGTTTNIKNKHNKLKCSIQTKQVMTKGLLHRTLDSRKLFRIQISIRFGDSTHFRIAYYL